MAFPNRVRLPLPLIFIFVSCQIRSITGQTISKEGCGTSKTCHFDPAACDPAKATCVSGITYRKNGDVIEFELLGKLESPNSASAKYVAVGFSQDANMGNDAVTYCLHSPSASKVFVSLAYNPGKSNKLVTDRTLIESAISGVSSTLVNGIIHCRFSQKIQPPSGAGSNTVYPLDKEYYLLLVTGTADDQRGGPSELKIHSTEQTSEFYPKVLTAAPVSLVSQLTPTNSSNSPSLTAAAPTAAYPKWKMQLAQSHAILMLFGWWLLVACSILLARYFKSMMAGRELCGTGYWFQLHRALNILGVLAIAGAFVCMFVSKDAVWTGSLYDYSHPRARHAILGMTASIGGFVQPIMAIFRCDKDAPKRPIFNWLHRFLGLASWACASAAIWFTGDFMVPLRDGDRYGNVPRGLMIFYWVALGVVVIGLEIWICLAERMKSKRRADTDIPLNTLRGKTIDTSVAPPKGGLLRVLLLLFFLLVAIAVTVSLACFIAM